ncbi:MAG: hypothetical protein ACI8O8_002957 [Oleiphilaceae bacterium]
MEQQEEGKVLVEGEREELKRLRKEVFIVSGCHFMSGHAD